MGFKVYDTGNSNGNDTKNEYQIYNSNNDGLANSNPETNSYTSFNSNDTMYELNNEAVIASNNSFKESVTKTNNLMKKLSTLIITAITGGSLALTGVLLGTQVNKLQANLEIVEVSSNEITVSIETEDEESTYKVVCETRDKTTYSFEYIDQVGPQELVFDRLEASTFYKMYILSNGYLIDTITFKTLSDTTRTESIYQTYRRLII